MEKKIQFTDKQKELIWKFFVLPQGGTKEESELFVERCEISGLNPIEGDVVFTKHVSQKTGKTQVRFIVTRDAMLKAATMSSDYVGPPVSSVVREGDEFVIEPTKAVVHHKFGSRRGKIIGSYAVLKHKRFDPVVVFVEFDEYFRANSSSSKTWQQYPAVMIQKVAETFALRRQFPILSGFYIPEEMGGEEIPKHSEVILNADGDPSPLTIEEETKEEEKREAEAASSLLGESASIEESASKDSEGDNVNEFNLLGMEEKEKGNGVKYLLITVVNNATGEKLVLFAPQGESMDEAKKIPADKPFRMKYRTVTNAKGEETYILESVLTNETDSEGSEVAPAEPTSSPSSSPHDEMYLLIKEEEKTTPKGIPYFLLSVRNVSTGEEFFIISRDGEKVKKIPLDKPFKMVYREENGFKVLQDVKEA